MFTRKIKTVASVMESFRNTIADLQDIIEATITKNVKLNEQRTALDEVIKTNIAEIQQAHSVENRLNDLVYGPDPVAK